MRQELSALIASGRPIRTNDLKKGDRVRLVNGWEADVVDNLRGFRRDCLVFGKYSEIGSVYSHDIAAVLVGDTWHTILHTPKQIKLRDEVRGFDRRSR